jgi:hypothetical protein
MDASGTTSLYDRIYISKTEVAFATDAASSHPILTIDTSSNTIRFEGVSSMLSNLTVHGQLFALGSVVSLSDSNVKTDICGISNAIEKVCHLHGITYRRINETDREVGLLAQEVQQVLPEAVKPIIINTSNSLLTVSYGNLAGLFVEALKEIKSSLDELRIKVDDLSSHDIKH